MAAPQGALSPQPAHKGPKSTQLWVSTPVGTIFERPGAASVRALRAWVVQTREIAAHLDETRNGILFVTADAPPAP